MNILISFYLDNFAIKQYSSHWSYTPRYIKGGDSKVYVGRQIYIYCHIARPQLPQDLSSSLPSILRWQYGVIRQRAETPLPPVLLLCQWDGLNDSHTFLWSHHLPSPRPTALSKRTGGRSPVLPALSADAVGGCNIYNLRVVFSRKEEIQDKTKITVVVLWGLWRLTTESERALTLPCISWLLCCILSRHPYTIMNGEM